MLKYRVIPCLLLKDGGLYKTQRFKDPKYVGDPVNSIKIFNDKEVDEIAVIDISASRNNREPDYSLIEQFASECFMPFCYGGGIHTSDQAARIFSLGIEKISLHSALFTHPGLITEVANRFGSQSVTVSVDIKRNWLRQPRVFNSRTRRTEDMPWLDFIRSLVDRGAGEIILNATDRDGTMNGYDLALIREAAAAIDVPLIALGGAANIDHLREAIDAGASAVSAGSMFVYHGPHRAVLINYPRQEDLAAKLS
ncbi:AglZ/HisF2 family acetamidino modification protein [Neisseriaceae bacterium JH1-16]|nr:AglZ/HisF2 family acetamidino modification protein [Neisseriaceae bacterium JH1-16]